MTLAPDYAEAHNNRGVSLQELKRYVEALASYDQALALRPDYAEAHNNRGVALQELKHYDAALASYDKALAIAPDYAAACNNRGAILVTKGDMQEAEQMFRQALALKPGYPNPLCSLAAIRQYRDADHADIKQLQRLLDEPGISLRDRAYLYFALGKSHDDCGLYDDAFEYYRQANQILNADVVYDSAAVSNLAHRLSAVFSKEFLAQRFSYASDSQVPLFIVGMPRSGTTLMASILSNHRCVGTAGELTAMIDGTLRLPDMIADGISYPQAAKHITPAIAGRLIDDYEQRLRCGMDADVVHVVDKHPFNFKHLGLISMLFPEARIIHCTRHPLDTCLSNYFQRFSLENDYSFDLRNIGHFYAAYAQLMDHWRQALPRKMLEISYEDMIANTEQTARRALDFVGLEWDQRCLAPHTNPCAVETASNWQVRQPIYRQSVQRWRHYEKHLAPLTEMLPHGQGP